MPKKYVPVAAPVQPETPQPPVEDLGYVVGVWGGFDNYSCKKCHYATLNLKSIQEHVAHHDVLRTVTRVSPLIGPRGEQVIVEEVAHAENSPDSADAQGAVCDDWGG